MLQLKQLRKKLHQYPELSGKEHSTANSINKFILDFLPTSMITDIGGHGLLAIYEYSDSGPIIAIRSELDALPISENNNFDYASKNPKVSHKCGHDGHMTIVAGLAPWLKEQKFTKGTVTLLFQPAEETGQGAKTMLQDDKLENFNPDYIFALHNLPGYPLHEILTVKNQFNATVISLAMYFRGKTSHASEPEKGNNPSLAISELCIEVLKLTNSNPEDEAYSMITPVHTTIGTKDYGISPGYGEIHFTIRTWNQQHMSKLLEEITQLAGNIGYNYNLEFTTEKFDYFPSVSNNDQCNKLIKKAAKNLHLSTNNLKIPIRFGEDFGYFTNKYKGAMFGLGAGIESPPLHNPEYDFPDELIETGLSVFKDIIMQLLSDN